jgi:uncharacterized protein
MIKSKYKIEGLHCGSCELIIEDRLKKESGFFKSEINSRNSEILIESKEKISKEKLNQIFKKNGYKFLKIDKDSPIGTQSWKTNWWIPVVIVIFLFLGLNKLGLGNFLNINNKSSLLAFLGFGIIAGFSSCGALMSGIILSRPKETIKILLGRILGYSILGIILGMVGEKIRINGAVMSTFMVLISVVMLFAALQMMGVKITQKIKLGLPKGINKKILNGKMAILLGFFTVFLPCGFTLLAESVAIISGNWLSGFLIMLFFVLGTSIPLFLIGKSGDKFFKNGKSIGVIIIFFVIYNLSFQFGWLNVFSKVNLPSFEKGENNTQKIQNQKASKIIKLEYTRFGGLNPNPIVVKKGEKVRLEIDVKENEYGCMSTILLPKLFNRAQTLTAGKILIMEFTPITTGVYPFVCAMWVPHKGVLNVIE